MKVKFTILLIGLMALFLTGMNVQAQTNAYTIAGKDLPTVSSDKDDYSPGQIAYITGTGWTLDSLVNIHFEETPEHEHHHGYHDTKVNPDGTWMIEYPIEERHLGVTFTVIVVGKTSGFQTQTIFTDAAELLTPRAGVREGGTGVTIGGAGFSNGSYGVTFDGIPSSTIPNRQSNGTLNNITSPAHSSGSVDIVVTGPNAGSTSTILKGYTYACRDNTNLVFDENMGTLASGSILMHEDGNRFQNTGLTMTGNQTSVLTSVPSSSSDYSWASGGGYVFIDNVNSRNFQIAGINTTGLQQLELSYAISKSTNPSNGSDLIVEVSTNGTTYTQLSVAPLPAVSGSNGWYYRTISAGIPATANLRIRFRQTGTSTEYKLDDIRLISSPPITSQPISITKCLNDAAIFSVVATGPSLSYQWRKNNLNIAGANGADFTIPSVLQSDAGSYDAFLRGATNDRSGGQKLAGCEF